jgi:hypothetical protein
MMESKTKFWKVALLQVRVMKYIEFLWALDILYRYYPRYHTHDLIVLADDIYKWMNNELPENSSTLIYLKSCFSSPTEAFKAVWNEIQLLAGPYMHPN